VTTVTAPATLWRGPGIYTADELPLEAYHADIVPGGSLSSSGARKLLAPSCPAQFRYDQQHPQAPKKEFDLGHAAHRLVLDDGPELVEVKALRWDSIKVKAEVQAIRDAGAVPLKTAELEQVQAMAAAIRQHPLAGPLFTPGTGVAEQSLYWADPHTGVTCRARPDWLKNLPGLVVCVDYKTAADASPDAVSKAIGDRGYHMQDPWYLDGIQAVTGQQARFIFVVQSKTAPYLITVRELADADRAIGRAKNQRALRIYAECERTGIWPDWTGPTTDIPYISLPTWQAVREADEYL
jgi:hypothetical protein